MAMSGSREIAYLFATVVFVGLLTAVPANSATTPVMITETVDNLGDVGRFTSIAVDSTDKIHISYYDNISCDVKYATNAGGSWTTYVIDGEDDVGQCTSIAVDKADKIHISYFDYTYGGLKYATNSGGSWTTETVDACTATSMAGWDGSIAVDSNYKIHISYVGRINYTNYVLKYATNAGGSWATQTIENITHMGGFTSIAVDSNDNIHISYIGVYYYDMYSPYISLKYATNMEGSWSTYAVDSTGDAAFDNSIAVDSNNHIHISYHDNTNSDLKYATNAGGSWATYIVDSKGTGDYSSIAVDSTGTVHISYFDGTSDDLKYATNAGSHWSSYVVDSTGVVGGYTSIACDSNGTVHISYYDFTNGDLKHAWGQITSSNPQTGGISWMQILPWVAAVAIVVAICAVYFIRRKPPVLDNPPPRNENS
jgi:hypothetical protein